MGKTHDPIFITGKAGTGKSTLLNYFREHTTKKIAVTAPTGIAALNVSGETIHSFFKFPSRPIITATIKKVSNSTIYKALDILIIDEISMVRADMLDGIDRFLRLNGKKPNLPFGGIQLILIGDLFQLPPIISNDAERQFLQMNYKTPYFFSAKALETSGLKILELTHVFRQTDAGFIALLNAVRNNTVRIEDLAKLNARCDKNQVNQNKLSITLTTTNKRAQQINTQKLEQLSGKSFEYSGITTGKFENVTETNLPAPNKLVLKKGAQVMFVKNDGEYRWVNGTMGTVYSLSESRIQIQLAGNKNNDIVDIKPAKWEMIHYVFNEKTKEIETSSLGSFNQYPVILAYAITIHKSQGKTFDQVTVDLTDRAFAHGQLYVALSRCRSLEGLTLVHPISRRDIIVDPDILLLDHTNVHLLN
ncbi:MAG: AAA family ATPase [Desulfobacterales bacterium]|nr:AAA family ATPase [Desulfobacterales bacterium]